EHRGGLLRVGELGPSLRILPRMPRLAGDEPPVAEQHVVPHVGRGADHRLTLSAIAAASTLNSSVSAVPYSTSVEPFVSVVIAKSRLPCPLWRRCSWLDHEVPSTRTSPISWVPASCAASQLAFASSPCLMPMNSR